MTRRNILYMTRRKVLYMTEVIYCSIGNVFSSKDDEIGYLDVINIMSSKRFFQLKKKNNVSKVFMTYVSYEREL